MLRLFAPVKGGDLGWDKSLLALELVLLLFGFDNLINVDYTKLH